VDPFQHAQELYAGGRVHDALEVAQSACERQPRDPDRWWLLGRISRHAGLEHASDAAFQRAAELSARHRVPVRLPRPRFRELVREAMNGAAAPRIVPLPDTAAMAAGTPPDALTAGNVVYQVNVENRCHDESEVAALLRRTLTAATA
jgi:hypothetical protein